MILLFPIIKHVLYYSGSSDDLIVCKGVVGSVFGGLTEIEYVLVQNPNQTLTVVMRFEP